MSDGVAARPELTALPPDALRMALERALGAQYDVLTLLGRGGMGAVYLARERLLERLVAIKVLPGERTDGEARERFLREARTAAQLSHPNIVPLLSFGEMGDTLFYIMRYVDGESLEARLRREGTLAPDEARRILRELADALAEAHRLGIVHRDIKPDNVMVERATGRAMLTDFGVARQLGGSATLTATGMIVGSPQYMSPEQASGDRTIDGRSDLYSLGIIGYRMLTGHLPFSGDTVRELLLQQITVEAINITTRAPDVPIEIADALMRCLEKDPARRWSDAQSFGSAIAQNRADPAALPDALDGVPRGGTKMLQITYLIDLALVALYGYTNDPEWLRIAAGASVMGFALLAVGLWVRLRRAKLSFRRALPLAFWPGERSFLWWPRALRPPGDVFDRLPLAVRRARIWQTAGVALFSIVGPVLLVASYISGYAHRTLTIRLLETGFGAGMAGLFAIGVAAVSQLRWKGRWPVTPHESAKLLGEPTHNSRFWERPAVAALLGSARVTASGSPATVDGMAQAIGAIAAGLPVVADSIAEDASAAVRELVAELRSLDERIRELASQVDAAEQQRLNARLAALGPERADESDVGRQMRALLHGQASLFSQLDAQRTALDARRDALREQLRTLWLQMVNYGAQVAAQSLDVVELSGRIRELCRSIERRTSAVSETEDVLRRS